MSWFADLAGKAETLLNNLDEQTGAALRNHNVVKTKKHNDKHDYVPNNEPVWPPKKRPIPRNTKKVTITETRSNYGPVRKSSPISHQSRSQGKESQDYIREYSPRNKRSPTRKPSPQYTLNHCPKTLVGDINDTDNVMDQFGFEKRRFSLPADLELINNESLTYKMQNLEVENAMLKNELNVMNREVSELLDRLRKTEDGNVIIDNKELTKTQTNLENCELLNHRVNLEKESLTSQMDQLKHRIHELTTIELNKYKKQNTDFENEVSLLQDRNNELEEKIKQLNEKTTEKESAQMKIENDFRHAQVVICDLQNNLEKSTAECHRLEKDWETYKLRVKSMLYAKDNEIKALQEGINLTEDTKILMEQLENLKEEREGLSEAVFRVRGECAEMKAHMEQLELRHNAAERIIAALRDALKDERIAKNKVEAQCISYGKDLKALQMESAQTIANLRTALRDKESELDNLREISSTVRTTDTSALNVADYDVMQDSIDNEKIQYLTQALVQKQEKVDSLLADNNILKIQLEKLESKYKTEVVALRAHQHSVVHVHDGETRSRTRTNKNTPESTMSVISMRIGVFIKRYPIFRIFIFFYMMGLHFWVLTVLFTSTPEDYIRPTKS